MDYHAAAPVPVDVHASASAPAASHLESEPPAWRPRSLWIGTRLLCGAVAFFFASFLFAYFYLRLLDTNHSWKIGKVSPPTGYGVAIVVVLVLSGVLLALASRRAELLLRAGSAAVALGLISIALQALAWSSVGFGPASGGYASVWVGWTAAYAFFTLPCLYWLQTQVATAWRTARVARATVSPQPGGAAELEGGPELARAGVAAASYFWNFYVAIGVIMFVVLYLV